MRVKFTETRVVDDHRKGTRSEESYAAGKSYNLDEASALHWIARGVAVEVVGRAAAPSPAAPVAPAEKSPNAPDAGTALTVTKPSAIS